jgi:nanoRNase/pAp phosphatase (c-di-AMP/oligoRNAs hydrolase)
VVVFGLSEDTYFISARNKSKDLHIGEFFKDGFEHMGSAGGHATTAGAQIPKTAFRSKQALMEHLFDLFKV